LFSIVLLKTLKRAAEGERFAWDKLERTAAMSYQPPAEEQESVKVP
jgi:peptidoglycan-N-acetylglucosamine deacetylase